MFHQARSSMSARDPWLHALHSYDVPIDDAKTMVLACHAGAVHATHATGGAHINPDPPSELLTPER